VPIASQTRIKKKSRVPDGPKATEHDAAVGTGPILTVFPYHEAGCDVCRHCVCYAAHVYLFGSPYRGYFFDVNTNGVRLGSA
jgi:hypothetical protein